MITVTYAAEQSATTSSFSPSSSKPAELMSYWLKRNRPINVVRPVKATVSQMAMAHDIAYIEGVLRGEIPNGFSNLDRAVADTLLWTTGSLWSACIHRMNQGRLAAPVCSPTSGFHHASWAEAAGYCTFNGLVVAARLAIQHGIADTVAIIDCDYHYGDGTDEILSRVGGPNIIHWSAGKKYHRPQHAKVFLEDLSEVMASLESKNERLLVIYQAGADAHIDDPLGGFLTTEQMRQRDAIVFGNARFLGLPVVWNLAGGYQRDEKNSIDPVLQLHDNTLLEACKAYGIKF